MSSPLLWGAPSPLTVICRFTLLLLLQLVMTVNDFYSVICGLFLPRDCKFLEGRDHLGLI